MKKQQIETYIGLGPQREISDNYPVLSCYDDNPQSTFDNPPFRPHSSFDIAVAAVGNVYS